MHTYLALGDSYTIGEAVAESDRFPAQLAQWLHGHGIELDKPQYIATTGWTCADLEKGIDAADPRGPFGLVTLLIGVNDQYQKRSTDGYRAAFSHLLLRALSLAGGNKRHVVVVSIPDYGVTPFGNNDPAISRQIDEFNAINRQVTGAAGVAYADITPLSKRAKDDPSLVAGDGLHPSARQYADWVTVIAPLVLKGLKD